MSLEQKIEEKIGGVFGLFPAFMYLEEVMTKDDLEIICYYHPLGGEALWEDFTACRDTSADPEYSMETYMNEFLELFKEGGVRIFGNQLYAITPDWGAYTSCRIRTEALNEALKVIQKQVFTFGIKDGAVLNTTLAVLGYTELGEDGKPLWEPPKDFVEIIHKTGFVVIYPTKEELAQQIDQYGHIKKWAHIVYDVDQKIAEVLLENNFGTVEQAVLKISELKKLA